MTDQAHRNNSFDLIRLLLASAVLVSHAYLLGGFDGEPVDRFSKGQTIAGTLAVLGFFGLSGFLVAVSFLNRQEWRSFAAARLLRILPGLLLALFLTAFVFAPLISYSNPAEGTWTFGNAFQYFLGNSLIKVRQWSIGDELVGLPYEGSTNGPLWSLWPEVLCYAFVLLAGSIGMLKGRSLGLISAFGVLLVLHVAIATGAKMPEVPSALVLTGYTPLFVAFLSGSILAAFRNEIPWSLGQALFWGLACLALLRFGGWTLAGPIALTLALLHAGHTIQAKLPADLSYGIYLLHFPVLHLLAAAGINQHGLFLYSFATILVVFPLAWASWTLIEKPCLALKSSFRVVHKPG